MEKYRANLDFFKWKAFVGSFLVSVYLDMWAQ